MPQTLDALLSDLGQRFPTRFETVTLDGLALDVLQMQDMRECIERLAEQATGVEDLPLWARVWPAAVMLGYLLRKSPPPPGSRVLELGAGVGLTGLAAASLGAEVVITDKHPDAVSFCQAGILRNGLADRAEALRLDFTAEHDPLAGRRFDRILGAEICYLEEAARPLARYLERHLAPTPEAMALLACDHARAPKKLLGFLDRDFHIEQQLIGVKEQADAPSKERHLCAIYRCRRRRTVAPAKETA